MIHVDPFQVPKQATPTQVVGGGFDDDDGG
jgi:hypothetical protein